MEIRKATKDDRVAPIILLAAKCVFSEYKVGMEEEICEYLFSQPNNGFSYENTTLLIEDNKIIGLFIVYDSNIEKKISKNQKKIIKDKFDLDVEVVDDEGVENTYYLDTFVIDEPYQNKGYSKILFEEIKRNYPAISLLVEDTNIAAQKTYLKQGFEKLEKRNVFGSTYFIYKYLDPEVGKLIQTFEENSDHEKKVKMEKYLIDQFPFLGIPKPKRAELEKDFINYTVSLPKNYVVKLMFVLHTLGEREYMYTAQQIGYKNVKRLEFKDLILIMKLIEINGWWENSDGYNIIFKKYFKLHPKEIIKFVNKYYKSKKMWTRRVSIICQLGLKELTDKQALEKTILFNEYDNQFFIQKAIGWSLRDLYRTDQKTVDDILSKFNPSKLVLRESYKHKK